MKTCRLLPCVAVMLSAFSALAIAQGLDSRSDKALTYPDLAVNSIKVVPEPKEGRAIDSVVINIMNRGEVDSAECTIGLSCEVIKCDDGDRCAAIGRAIAADVPVPALKPREATDVEWRPSVPLTWFSGKYAIICYIDKYDVIRELNEANNTYRRLVYLNPATSSENR